MKFTLVKKNLSAFFLAIILSSSTSAAIHSYTDRGLDFTINNDDPFAATIDFDPYSLDVNADTISQSLSGLSTTTTTVTTVLEPRPAPLPFPPPPIVKTVTTTIIEAYGATLNWTAQLLANSGLATMGSSGPVPLKVGESTTTFEGPIDGYRSNAVMQFTQTETGTRNVTTTVETFEDNVLVNTETTTITGQAFSHTAFDDQISLSLAYLHYPTELDPTGFPDSVELNSALGTVHSTFLWGLYDESYDSILGYDYATFRLDASSAEAAVIQAQVVPIPAAAWLFGSALLGFAGFRRFNKEV